MSEETTDKMGDVSQGGQQPPSQPPSRRSSGGHMASSPPGRGSLMGSGSPAKAGGGAPGGGHNPNPVPRPKPSKAERREQQEAQRAAKALRKAGNEVQPSSLKMPSGPAPPGSSASSPAGSVAGKTGGDKDDEQQVRTLSKKGSARAIEEEPKVLLHSKMYNKKNISMSKMELHPSIVSLGMMYAKGGIRGANARTAAMLLAFKEVIASYSMPTDRVVRLNTDLDRMLKPHIQYLIDCRPHSIAMGNAIKFVRNLIAQVKPDTPESQAKEELMEAVETYVTERITFSSEMIAKKAADKIVDGDVVLVYGRSFSVESALKLAAAQGKNFRVVVVDARPLLEGKRLLKALGATGIACTYVNLCAVSYIMRTVNKVLLGAAALLSNGAVISRAGTALVAMTARRFNVPTIVCCETYKFSDKVQLDSICWNEVGDDAELDTDGTTLLEASKTIPSLRLLNLRYDTTPMKYVSLVITEVGMIPPTSVPVLLREARKDDAPATFDL